MNKLYIKWLNFFKKQVFSLERKKFAILDKVFPKYDEKIQKKLVKKRDKKLEKATSELEKERINDRYKSDVLAIRTEKNRRKNVNYHFDKDNPYNTLLWLNKNKAIHQKGLIKNFRNVVILIILSIINFNISSNILGLLIVLGIIEQTISTFININCVLLQNYNIKKVNHYIKGPYQKYKKRLEKKVTDYHVATEVVADLVNNSPDMPTVDDIVNKIVSKEQALIMLKLINSELNYRLDGDQNLGKGLQR